MLNQLVSFIPTKLIKVIKITNNKAATISGIETNCVKYPANPKATAAALINPAAIILSPIRKAYHLLRAYFI